MGGKRRTFTDEHGQSIRRCRGCEQEFALTEEHFSPCERDAAGFVIKWGYECKPCAAKRKASWYDAIMADDVRRKKLREEERKLQKRWREKNPDKTKAAAKRRAARIKSDPQRHARSLENRRIEYALRAERRGKPVNRHISTAARVKEAGGRCLPAAPLAKFLQAKIEQIRRHEKLRGIERADGQIGEVLGPLGISTRSLWAWNHGEVETVQIAVAERAIVRSDTSWQAVWPEAEFPELYAEGGPLHEEIDEAA